MSVRRIQLHTAPDFDIAADVKIKLLTTVEILGTKYPNAGLLTTKLGTPLEEPVEKAIAQACYLLMNEVPRLYRDDAIPLNAADALSAIINRLCELDVLSPIEFVRINSNSMRQ